MPNTVNASSLEEKTPKKTWIEKVIGVSTILKIVIALFTIAGIVTPIVVSKTSTHTAAFVDSTVAPVKLQSTTISSKTTQRASPTETTINEGKDLFILLNFDFSSFLGN